MAAENQTKERGMRTAYQGAPMQSSANAPAAPSANALCRSGAWEIGTQPTPMSPNPTSPISARITARAPRLMPKPPNAIPLVSIADKPAMPPPEAATATLKHIAAKSPDVPRVLKLCTHHSPVGVMLMLARLPAASSMATRLKVRYASCSMAWRCSRPVLTPMASASAAPTVRWPPGTGSNASEVKCTPSIASAAQVSPFATERLVGPGNGRPNCARPDSPVCDADAMMSAAPTAAPPARAGAIHRKSMPWAALLELPNCGARARRRTTDTAPAMSSA